MRHWTEEEAQYLFDNCGVISNKQIARNLGRTPHAIRQKLYTNQVSVFSNFYSATLLGKELGRHKSTVMKWYRKGWLNGRVAGWGRGYFNRPMIFVENSIVAFLKKFHRLFDWKKIPNLYFRNIVREAMVGY